VLRMTSSFRDMAWGGVFHVGKKRGRGRGNPKGGKGASMVILVELYFSPASSKGGQGTIGSARMGNLVSSSGEEKPGRGGRTLIFGSGLLDKKNSAGPEGNKGRGEKHSDKLKVLLRRNKGLWRGGVGMIWEGGGGSGGVSTLKGGKKISLWFAESLGVLSEM